MAQLHHLAPGDLPVLVDVVEDHLLVLDGGEALLARVGSLSGIPGIQLAGKNVFANGRLRRNWPARRRRRPVRGPAGTSGRS